MHLANTHEMNAALMTVIGVYLAGTILFLWPCLLIAAHADKKMDEFGQKLARRKSEACLED